MNDAQKGVVDGLPEKVFLAPPNPDIPSFIIVPPYSVEGGEERRERMMDQLIEYIIGAIRTVLQGVGEDLSRIEVSLNTAQVARIVVPVRRISGEVRAQMTVSLQRSEAKTREVSRATPCPPTPDSVRGEIMQILRFLITHQRTPTNPNGWGHCDRASAYTNAHIGARGEHTIRLNAWVPDGLEADSGGTLSTSITVAFDECSEGLRAELERVLNVGFDFFMPPGGIPTEDIPRSLMSAEGGRYVKHILTNPLGVITGNLTYIADQMALPEGDRNMGGIRDAQADMDVARENILERIAHIRKRFQVEIDDDDNFGVKMNLGLFERAVRANNWVGENGAQQYYEDLERVLLIT